MNTHLYFEIGDNKYAINTANVLEIMKLPALDYPQKLPNNINLRVKSKLKIASFSPHSLNDIITFNICLDIFLERVLNICDIIFD